MSITAYYGEIRAFPYSFAPSGWKLCAGQELSISSYSALFSLSGNFYGGNGTSTFALPDLRQRAPIMAGQAPGLSNHYLGDVSGYDQISLPSNSLPQHEHTVTYAGTVTVSESD